MASGLLVTRAINAPTLLSPDVKCGVCGAAVPKGPLALLESTSLVALAQQLHPHVPARVPSTAPSEEAGGGGARLGAWRRWVGVFCARPKVDMESADFHRATGPLRGSTTSWHPAKAR